MHNDMEQVLNRYAQTQDVMVATVECDTTGKNTCNGIRSYPSIYYTPPGDASKGQQTEYTGGRDYNSMYRFIDHICGWSSGNITTLSATVHLPVCPARHDTVIV